MQTPMSVFSLRLYLIPWLLTMLCLAACTPQPAPREGDEVVLSRSTFSFDQGKYPSDLDLFPEYHIAPGDQLDVIFQIRRQLLESVPITLEHSLEIKFIETPEFNSTQQVLPTGKIALPYIGEIYVLDKTAPEVADELRKKFSKTLVDPELMVRIVNIDVRMDQLRKDLHTAPRGLSRLVLVRPDGYATFPLIGDVLVAGMTIPQTHKVLQPKYHQYLEGLKVDLFLHEQVGSVVYVLGEVQKPGPYKILKPISVMEAVAMSQGYSGKAKLDSVVVFRKYEKQVIARVVNLEQPLEARKGGMFFYLRPDDVVFIPKTKIGTAAELMRQIGDIIFFRGWSISTETLQFSNL